MNTAHKTTAFLLITTVLGTAACASTTPPELLTARGSYQRVSQGMAAQQNPAGLHAGKEALDAAEASFDDHGDTQETRDLAYSADRKIQIAEVKSRELIAAAARDRTLADMNNANAAQVQITSAALGDARQQLATEKERREQAEKRAAQAAADLAKFASVKQESRGMVITLNGSVLFASAKWELLPSAQTKLNDVATALAKESPESQIIVEGHTDSQGALAMNQELSQKRAESVRSYLISRGIAADRITAQGFGPGRPIADNNSPEGRANNRRVEIVVGPQRTSQ